MGSLILNRDHGTHGHSGWALAQNVQTACLIIGPLHMGLESGTFRQWCNWGLELCILAVANSTYSICIVRKS